MTSGDPARKRIVLVEDEPELRANYVLALRRAGFDVDAHGTAVSATEAVARRVPDVAILDIGLGADTEAGFDLCRALRTAHARLPILFLSARGDDLDIVSGLRLGADDYLTKDASLAVLVARVTTLLRRVEAFAAPPAEASVRETGPLRLDLAGLAATWHGRPVALSVSEFHLVACLAHRPGQVCDRVQLMEAANLVLDEQTITAHVKRIRAKFVALDPAFAGIQTVYGRGYRWLATLDY